MVRAGPPGVHDLSQQPSGYLNPVIYQYLRAHNAEGLLPYHLAAAAGAAPGAVAPPPRSPIVPKTEPDLEDATGRAPGAAAVSTAAPPGSSPPLELRRPLRPASGAAATAVHSLQSPHDRATDSPLVATVYRLPHYAATSRYYPAEEPPPAHVHAVAGRAGGLHPQPAPEAPISIPGRPSLCEVATPPLASQVPPQHDSLLMLLQVGYFSPLGV